MMTDSNSTMYSTYTEPQHLSLTGSSRPTYAPPLGDPILTNHSVPYRNSQDGIVRSLLNINWIQADAYIPARIPGSIHTIATLLVPLDPIHYPYILRSLPLTLHHLIYPYPPLISSRLETKKCTSLPMVIKVHPHSLLWVNAKLRTIQMRQELQLNVEKRNPTGLGTENKMLQVTSGIICME